MALSSFFKRLSGPPTGQQADDPAGPPSASPLKSARRKAAPEAAAAAEVPHESPAIVQARTHARRRLMGAAVLLLLGVLLFPLVFETQPRPLPMDLPITVSSGKAAPGAPALQPVQPVPSPPTAQPVQAAPPAQPQPAAVEQAAPAQTAESPRPAPPMITEKAEPEPAAPAAPAAAPAPVPSVAATAPPASSTPAGRFVVQVGAFADEATVRQTRQKVEKLGLKTYTQEVNTEAGKRVRVRLGPFAERDEAAKVLQKLKGAGLPGAVLAL